MPGQPVYLLRDTFDQKMLGHMNNLTIAMFNCRSVKSSRKKVFDLCDKCDLVLLQEHWLLPNELDILCSLHPDIYAVGKSSVDISANVLVGRPYGDTAILYKKTSCRLNQPCRVI